MSGIRLATVTVPGGGAPWTALGFTVVDDAIPFANGAFRVGGAVCSLGIDGPLSGAIALPADIEGIPVAHGVSVAPAEHANGAVELDHLVIMTDSLERTSAAVESTLGLSQRRIRETDTVRQAFHRFGGIDGTPGCIIEIVERRGAPPSAPVALWGAVVVVDDLDAAVVQADGLLGAPRDAVQPGRRIATASRAAGLPFAVALMSR